MNVCGILALLAEIEVCFMSACSVAQLISKLLDFQKNICKHTENNDVIDAENFARELAKIEPQHMQTYNFEYFLIKKNSEGYR